MDDGWHFSEASQEWWYWQDEEITVRVALEAWADYRREAMRNLMSNFDRIDSAD